MQEIKIVSDEESKTKILIDGKEIQNVVNVNFNQSADTVPEFVISTMSMPNICIDGGVIFSFTPQTVREACIVLKNELEKSNSPVRAAFKVSIKSAIDEAPNYMDMDKLAELILERIIGEK